MYNLGNYSIYIEFNIHNMHMQQKIPEFFISTFYAVVGLCFLFAAAREVYSFSTVIIWGIFIILCTGTVLALYLKASWLAYYQYIILLFYNPLVFQQLHVKDTFIGDIGIGILFFLIGLHWKKSVSSHY